MRNRRRGFSRCRGCLDRGDNYHHFNARLSHYVEVWRVFSCTLNIPFINQFFIFLLTAENGSESTRMR
jgi:hypothetical protein